MKKLTKDQATQRFEREYADAWAVFLANKSEAEEQLESAKRQLEEELERARQRLIKRKPDKPFKGISVAVEANLLKKHFTKLLTECDKTPLYKLLSKKKRKV